MQVYLVFVSGKSIHGLYSLPSIWSLRCNEVWILRGSFPILLVWRIHRMAFRRDIHPERYQYKSAMGRRTRHSQRQFSGDSDIVTMFAVCIQCVGLSRIWWIWILYFQSRCLIKRRWGGIMRVKDRKGREREREGGGEERKRKRERDTHTETEREG